MKAVPVNNSAPMQAWLRALEKTAPISSHPSRTLPAMIDDLARQFDAAFSLLGDGGCLSYRELAERCNRYARWALKHDFVTGKAVCLLMPNCPDYIAIWLGITRVGGIVSLVNTKLVGNQLVHAINAVAPKGIIAAGECIGAVAAIRKQLPPETECWAHGSSEGSFLRIENEIEQYEGDRLADSEYQPPSIRDLALYIYTSGTTGLPKAAKVSHLRLMQWSHWFAGMLDTRPNDRMYNCLPMYHSIGGVVATGAMLVNGGSVLIRQQFSASRFWEDVVESNCTVFQYIGELCRYLVNVSPNPWEVQHHLRLCCGNGLRTDIWGEFQRRFRIPQILEFYAATEGNFSLYNCEGKVGAIGRVPTFLAHRFPVALIRHNFDTGEPIRTEEGFCVRCSPNDVGEAIGKIVEDGSQLGSRFEGYTDSEATEKKILRSVFSPDDAWFRTGDLMRRDELGYFYFVDRVGDTFRWQGENVSTTEVSETIAASPGITEAVVYGVVIPGTEGRAGMAAIVVSDDFDLLAFRRYLVEYLPQYARPLFVRVCNAIEMTGTFKPRKQQLEREGYDPLASNDAVYFDDRERAAFVKVDEAIYRRVCLGKLRFRSASAA